MVRMGVPREQARKQFWLFDSKVLILVIMELTRKGLITAARGSALKYGQDPYARVRRQPDID